MMKRITTNTLKICSHKCIVPSDRDYLNNFEKSCLVKCTDKYVELYFKAQTLVAKALPEKEKELDNEF